MLLKWPSWNKRLILIHLVCSTIQALVAQWANTLLKWLSCWFKEQSTGSNLPGYSHQKKFSFWLFFFFNLVYLTPKFTKYNTVQCGKRRIAGLHNEYLLPIIILSLWSILKYCSHQSIIDVILNQVIEQLSSLFFYSSLLDHTMAAMIKIINY